MICVYIDLWCAVLFCTRCAVLHYLAMGCGRRYIPCLVQDVVLYWRVLYCDVCILCTGEM